jgi:hypothetical protein
MTYEFSSEAATLTEKCRSLFGDESRWITAGGYPHSLALSIIDSIFSTGSHYQSVINVVSEYRAYRLGQGGDADQDGTKELLATFEEVGGSAGWADLVNNHKPAHTRPNALLKAEVVKQAAEALQNKLDITTREGVHSAYSIDNSLAELKKNWLCLPSQSSGVTFNYFLILCGFQSVKPDRMVIRFVTEHAGLEGKDITPMQTAELIGQVAENYPTQPRRLDHVIWRHVSGREIFRADELN